MKSALAGHTLKQLCNMNVWRRDTLQTLTRDMSLVAAAARDDHLMGIPRKIVFSSVHAFSWVWTNILNTTTTINGEQLISLVHDRPKGTPLITYSNHMSTLDDPFTLARPGLRSYDTSITRWSLSAEDICFTNPVHSYFFRAAKCIPLDRFGSVLQPGMVEAVEKLKTGNWVNIYPQGRLVQTHDPISRLKWGLASLIVNAHHPTPPIVLPIGISGFEKVMPEDYMFNRRPYVPLIGKRLSVVVGSPFQFDVPLLMSQAKEAVACKSPVFGVDAVRNSPQALQSKLMELMAKDKSKIEGCNVGQSEDASASRLGLDIPPAENDGDETPESLIRKIEKVTIVGDEATRRLYAEIMEVARQKLDHVVNIAHEYAK